MALEEYSVVWLGVFASFLAGSATGVGAMPVLLITRLSPQVHDALLGFGAGVMLAAAFFSLLIPGLEAASRMFAAPAAAVSLVAAGFLCGGLFFYFADRLLPHEHFLFGPEGADPGQLRRIWLFVFAIAIHNFPEGLSVGVGFGSGDLENGMGLAIGMGIQNVPEGLAVAVALAGEGYRRPAALLIAAVTGWVEPIGGLVGAMIVSLAGASLPWMMAFAAGAMIYVISDEIIPETHRQGFERAATGSLMLGFAVMMFLEAVIG